MAPRADSVGPWSLNGLRSLLAPYPGRLEFAFRLGVICALTVLVCEVYQTPEPALTAYVAFFVTKPDRTASIATSIVFLLVLTLTLGILILVAMAVVDQPIQRVFAMAILSFCLLFVGSASKLKSVANIIALITAYGLDILGAVQIGEEATRGLLYVWLFFAIPIAVAIMVNLVIGPAPRHLAERALAQRIRFCAAMLRRPDAETRAAVRQAMRAGSDTILGWIKLAAAERNMRPDGSAALKHATRSTAVLLALTDLLGDESALPLAHPYREQIGRSLDKVASRLQGGKYPRGMTPDLTADDRDLSPISRVLLAEFACVLGSLGRVQDPASPAPAESKQTSGFFAKDAFSNPVYVRYALKTTMAAMICYFVYSVLDWRGIHTCLITCYIVALGTSAETAEKLTLRILGCLLGAGTGIAAIVYLMPDVTSIGALMGIVFGATLVSGWIAAGRPRIAYVGFQFAFAFFLCVVQGPGPEFDMTIVRDRVIGILFGNLVVALIFLNIWPVSVAKRIDPAISAFLRKLSAMAAVDGPRRWAIATEAQGALGALEDDLDLTAYEPAWIRPTRDWIQHRREITDRLATIQGPLLLAADQDPELSDEIARRLDGIAEELEAQPRPRAGWWEDFPSVGAPLPTRPAPDTGPVGPLIEARLTALEQAVAHVVEGKPSSGARYAPA